MGDVAEMMIDGTLCEECGEYIGGAVGHPRKCAACGEEEVTGFRPTGGPEDDDVDLDEDDLDEEDSDDLDEDEFDAANEEAEDDDDLDEDDEDFDDEEFDEDDDA